MENRSTSSITADQFATNVRPFKVFSVKEDHKNMVIGSSFVKNLIKVDPYDRCWNSCVPRLHYTGQKLELIKAYSVKKMKTVLLQVGTNSILEKNEYVDVCLTTKLIF